MFPDRVVHFGENLGQQVKGRPTKKQKSLIELPYVMDLKVHVLRFNMNLLSSPQRVPKPSCPFRGKIGRSGEGTYTEKAMIVDRAYICKARDSTGSKLQYDPDLISVACSYTELSISVRFGR